MRKRNGIKGDKDMEAIDQRSINWRSNWRSIIIFFAVAVILSGWAAAQVSESTRVYANLPAQIEISIPPQHKDLQMDGCEPDKHIAVTGSVEVKSNTDWGLTVAGSTSDGHMSGSTGSPVHTLHNSMTVQAQSPAGGPVSIPGTDSNPSTTSLLSSVGPGDFSGTGAIGLTFDQLFSWNDYADENYQITVILTAAPA